jgi:hypothetical protein
MTYDWDGRRTRRIQAVKLALAMFTGLAVPLVIAVWSYAG